ncbi:hypothetical protein TTHERM_000232999 (macronuclear) [Tetrahymena thermophila SB210]|uniref:Uncharacterized protein n=1 Tax=Tetrahymena thermophila (strain SB210) TaxID=312017 RepID=W7XDN0_TETTS|nr:hypothetical protein TTHERM_000232999 [Tetrahymena thermophila SB210]EWS74758.1 hypothetical protein TTHERM_000232999 [Tetrahymena thermophila SB210]|eukprot:XP_012652759.1 hypothetical protein TTHERM_000232999 [Tetrahymena thermophila SB210]
MALNQVQLGIINLSKLLIDERIQKIYLNLELIFYYQILEEYLATKKRQSQFLKHYLIKKRFKLIFNKICQILTNNILKLNAKFFLISQQHFIQTNLSYFIKYFLFHFCKILSLITKHFQKIRQNHLINHQSFLKKILKEFPFC